MSRLAFTLALLLGAASVVPAPGGARAQSYSVIIASSNRAGVTLTNYGLLGTNLTSRSPSFEFPIGSGYQHLTTGGLWIGATVPDSGITGVTTATMDASTGMATGSLSEFSPAATGFVRRSLWPQSRYYSPDAVSEDDIVAQFTDALPKATIFPEPHRPLGVSVTLAAYAWAYGGAEDVLFLRWTIRNVWSSPLVNVWVGLFTELASGNLNLSNQIPPTGWFSKKWLQYDASLRLLREHYCVNQPVPAGCNLAAVPYWAGVQLLTPPDTLAGQQVTLAAWPWAPADPARDTDVERYALMSAGTISPLTDPWLLPGTGDPVELLAVGPYASIAPGDSVVVDFALLGGAEPDTIRERAYLAQAMRNAGFPQAVVPAAASLAGWSATASAVTLRWFVPATPGARLSVQRREAAGEWTTLGERVATGTDLLEYEDRSVSPGARYAYRLGIDEGAGERWTAESWVQVPAAGTRFALEGTRPNPTRSADGAVLSFSLAASGPSRIECFDVLGRREAALDLPDLPAGAHAVPLARLGRLSPGLHLVRLSQGRSRASARVLVIP